MILHRIIEVVSEALLRLSDNIRDLMNGTANHKIFVCWRRSGMLILLWKWFELSPPRPFWRAEMTEILIVLKMISAIQFDHILAREASLKNLTHSSNCMWAYRFYMFANVCYVWLILHSSCGNHIHGDYKTLKDMIGKSWGLKYLWFRLKSWLTQKHNLISCVIVYVHHWPHICLIHLQP